MTMGNVCSEFVAVCSRDASVRLQLIAFRSVSFACQAPCGVDFDYQDVLLTPLLNSRLLWLAERVPCKVTIKNELCHRVVPWVAP